MSTSIDQKQISEVIHRIDPQSTLLRAWPLPGGVSAQVTAFEMERADGQTQKLVMRRHGERDRRQNPDVAAHEFKLLQVLESTGVAAPLPRYLDQSGELFPTPYLVVEYVEGETDSAPSDVDSLLQQMAAYLARTHRIDDSNSDLSLLRNRERDIAEKLANRPAELDDVLYEGQIRAALERVWPLTQRNRSVLLHGDFWPGNVLWKDGEIAAVIDWEDAAVGDPLADLANSRLEILWAFGVDAMQRFTDRYRSLTQLDYGNLPYWDLYAALHPITTMAGWGLDDDALQAMRDGHRWFTAQAFDALSAR